MSTRPFSASISSRGRQLVRTENYPVAPDTITFLFGESGIGKSIIAKALYGLLDPNEFEITVNGKAFAEHLHGEWVQSVQKSSFFVFQEPSSHLNPLMKISEQIREGSLKTSTHEEQILGRLWNNAQKTHIDAITDVFPKPYRPSGGEKQRILLAMAFKKISLFTDAGETDRSTFFVFDEPTGSLDNEYRNLFLDMLFSHFRKKKFTALVITHDYSIISQVYAAHKDLVAAVHFKELSRKADASVETNDFSANAYLAWINSIKAVKETPGQQNTVLSIRPDLEIFNRKLRICSDPLFSTPSDLVIRKGETVYIKAQSGVGKTTLAKIIMGLYEPQKFEMDLAGMTINERTGRDIWQRSIWGKKAGLVFQHADEALDLQATVKETFDGLPLKAALTHENLRNKLAELFEGKITSQFLDKKVAYLSGGQKQRLNLLRSLILDTDLIILDEPLNGLDFNSIKKVLALLEEKRRQGASFLMISHNEEIFDAFVEKNRVYYLSAT